MINGTRREFLADVGRGMLIASLGPALTCDLGLAHAFAGEGLDGPDTLTFGELEPLVALMQETPPDALMPLLVQRLAQGTDLRTLVAAGALANARTFGGRDYTGYHSLMALTPAYHMSRELPATQQALPVLKVLYRNTARMQEQGGRENEVLHLVEAASLPTDLVIGKEGEALREATRSADMDRAERTFAALAKGPSGEAFNHLLWAVQDEVDVHRVVLAWRAWVLLDIAGPEQAHTLLRQSVRYCVQSERSRLDGHRPESGVRVVLPKLMDEYRLIERGAGDRKPEASWIDDLAETIYSGSREMAAQAVAAALAEGFDPEAIGEALSLAANQLVLRDPGRTQGEAGKPVGSVHGASVGVHASDSANAWRNIARVSDDRNAIACLIVGAYHTAGQNQRQLDAPYPLVEHLEIVASMTDAAEILREADEAIQRNDQARACALVHRYGELDQPERPVFDMLLKYAVSEDGALHAEKYYRTVVEEFAAGQPAFRWRHLAALARVTASEHGYPAPGYAQARELLKS
jgi:hypothetical protein